jgi:hypothetical protein
MSRKIVINTHDGNTVWSVHVYDTFGQEHHLGYVSAYEIGEILIDGKEIQQLALDIWNNEVKKEPSSLSRDIHELHQIDKKSGILKGNRDGLD